MLVLMVDKVNQANQLVLEEWLLDLVANLAHRAVKVFLDGLVLQEIVDLLDLKDLLVLMDHLDLEVIQASMEKKEQIALVLKVYAVNQVTMYEHLLIQCHTVAFEELQMSKDQLVHVAQMEMLVTKANVDKLVTWVSMVFKVLKEKREKWVHQAHKEKSEKMVQMVLTVQKEKQDPQVHLVMTVSLERWAEMDILDRKVSVVIMAYQDRIHMDKDDLVQFPAHPDFLARQAMQDQMVTQDLLVSQDGKD